MIVVLKREHLVDIFSMSKLANIPHPEKGPSCASYRSLEIAALVLDRIYGVEERIRIVPICRLGLAQRTLEREVEETELTLRTK
jgi:hypothetical protein